MIKRNPRAHGRKKVGRPSAKQEFNPLLHALSVIRKYFDGKAYLTHSRTNGQSIIRYRLVTGRKEVVGTVNSRLVTFSYDKEMTEQQARKFCEEMGLC